MLMDADAPLGLWKAEHWWIPSCTQPFQQDTWGTGCISVYLPLVRLVLQPTNMFLSVARTVHRSQDGSFPNHSCRFMGEGSTLYVAHVMRHCLLDSILKLFLHWKHYIRMNRIKLFGKMKSIFFSHKTKNIKHYCLCTCWSFTLWITKLTKWLLIATKAIWTQMQDS